MEEESILKGCIQGDNDAWDLFLDSYAKVIYSTIGWILTKYRLSYNIDERIEDIFNLVILKLVENNSRKLKKYSKTNKNSSFESWLHVVVKHITIDYIRKEGKATSLYKRNTEFQPDPDELNDTDYTSNPEKATSDRETLRKVARVIKTLKSREQLIIELLYVKELPTKQVAGILQTTPENIHAIAHRIRKKIRKLLKDSE